MIEERSLADDKWVRVMCDFSADGLWNKEGSSVDPDELPVSDAIKARLRAWQDTYETCEDYLPPEQRKTTFDRDAFSVDGRAIAEAIKRELPDWTVIYFDDAKAERCNGEDRSFYEYELR